MFHDYPPGYMYVLYIVGAIEKLFGFLRRCAIRTCKNFRLLYAIFSPVDLIYKVAKKKFSDGLSNRVRVIYLFNPATVVNYSLWGQVDSVYTLFILLMIYFISAKEMNLFIFYVHNIYS